MTHTVFASRRYFKRNVIFFHTYPCRTDERLNCDIRSLWIDQRVLFIKFLIMSRPSARHLRNSLTIGVDFETTL